MYIEVSSQTSKTCVTTRIFKRGNVRDDVDMKAKNNSLIGFSDNFFFDNSAKILRTWEKNAKTFLLCCSVGTNNINVIFCAMLFALPYMFRPSAGFLSIFHWFGSFFLV